MDPHTTERPTARPESTEQPVAERAVDPPEARPGVPMSATPPRPAKGAHWSAPSRQPGLEKHLHREALDRPTPVAGTAQPPHGVSGLLRKKAYDVPEHRVTHWALLLLADRVDVLEDRIAPTLATPFERVGFARGSRIARSNPLGLIAGVVAGAWLTKRVFFQPRFRRGG